MSDLKIMKKPNSKLRDQKEYDSKKIESKALSSLKDQCEVSVGEILLSNEHNVEIWENPTEMYSCADATYDKKLEVLVKGIAFYEHHNMFIHAAKLIEVANKMQGHENGKGDDQNSRKAELMKKFIMIQKKYADY